MKALRVLVVDDDALIGMLLAEMLEETGYEVCGIEATEAGAVSTAARCHPDLLIVDVQLGAGSGISAVDEITRHGHVPHIFVSGDPSSVQACRPRAVCIRKPFREAELVTAMQRALRTVAGPDLPRPVPPADERDARPRACPPARR